MDITSNPASESHVAATTNSNVVQTPPPASTLELTASGGGNGAVSDLPACSGARSDSFVTHFCNIRGLCSNFPDVEHHLFSTKPHLLFLTETQLSERSDSNPYSVPSYCLYPQFSSNGGCCAYVCYDVSFSLVFQFGFPLFFTFFFWPSFLSITKFI